MKIAVVVGKTFNELEDMRKLANKRGHQLDIVVLDLVELSDLGHNPVLTSLRTYDLVHHRGGLGIVLATYIGTYLHNCGVTYLNSGTPLSILKSYQTLNVALAGILTPKTFIKGRSIRYEDIARKLGKTFIMKDIIGAGGNQVFLITSHDDFISASRYIKSSIVQEYIPNSCDYRIHTFDDKAVAVYRRVPKANEFRANVKQGGAMKSVRDTALVSRLYEMSENIARTMNSTIGGVDIIQSSKTGELFFIEINERPGWKDVHQITGVDIGSYTLDYYEQFHNKHKNQNLK